MSKVSWKGTVLLAPVPAAIVTCRDITEDGGERVNALTVGWCGVLCSHPPKTYISLRPSRYSYDMIKHSREFVINLTTESLSRAADYLGVRSGRDEDKLAAVGLHTEPASELSAPLLAESPVCLECRVCDIMPLGSHDMFLADIAAVDVDESLLDEHGRLMLERAGLIAYAHGDYYRLGERIGDFGFSVRRRKSDGYGKRPSGAKLHTDMSISEKDTSDPARSIRRRGSEAKEPVDAARETPAPAGQHKHSPARKSSGTAGEKHRKNCVSTSKRKSKAAAGGRGRRK